MRKTYVCVVVLFVLFFSAATRLSAQKNFQQQFQHDLLILLQEKNSRTPAQQKMDSKLLQAVREKNGQKMAEGVDLLPANVNAGPTGDVDVDITATITEDLISKIEGSGGKIISALSEFNSIRARVNLSTVETIAGYPEVKFITPAVKFITEGPGFTGNNRKDRTAVNRPMIFKREPANNDFKPFSNLFLDREKRIRNQLKNYFANSKNTINNSSFIGSITSQGDRAHRADDVRAAYGYAGQGIKIGVLSDSYNSLGGASSDVLNGDLPGANNPFGNTTAVTVLQDGSGGNSDEGRAMLQIVHDIAPKAQLFFATANGGSNVFANNILALRNTYHCDIIIDDVFYFNEPVFQDGVIAQAVNTVTADGALYFSSAGNEGSAFWGTSGYYEKDFSTDASLTFTFPGGSKAGTIQNFGTSGSPLGGDKITSPDGDAEAYTLNWSDASGASANDYDLFLVNAAGVVKQSSTNIQSGAQDPYESINPPTLINGDQLVIFQTAGAAVRAIALNTLRGTLQVSTSGQTHGHSSAANAFSVAATPAISPGPYPNAFSAINHVEQFSSDGPRRVFYNPDGSPITAGNFLFSTNGGTVRNKPDITAADGVSTTLPGSSGLNPFYGTSAAAPHAGAIAALLKSANPSLTTTQVRNLLTSTALDIESNGYDFNSGFGIIQAYQAMQSLAPTPLATLQTGTVTATEGTLNNGNGTIDPGENANILIQLQNASLTNATAVTATITTSTSGVSIINGTANYGTINGSSNATNTGSPFTILINSSVPCGTAINLIMTVSFSGGTSPATFPVTVVAGAQPFTNITSVLGGTPPTATGYTVTSGQQTGRIARSGTTSTCGSPKSNPGLTVATGSRQYDAYTFTNTSSASQCVTVILNSSNAANVYAATYNSAGFAPASPSNNYLADDGVIGDVQHTYSFNITAGSTFTVVVYDINTLPASNASYTLSVSLAKCSAAPTCTPVTITTATIANGTTGTPYSQSFAATGGSGTYIFSETGALPSGLNFSGNILSGTPTAGGSFPITITATDPGGCPAGTKNYTLVVGSNVPSTITAIAGTPQATYFGTAFSTALQAVVKDAFNVPVNGVSVTFTAPTTGATGTFAGNVSTATVTTDVNGIATAPTFTANTTLGTYNVVATIGPSGPPSASFTLTNADCTIICPSNITVSNDLNQCGAIVTYTAPTTSGSCGTVTSSPASGSFFPVGTTTVNVSSTTGGTCSFTITVNDTQAPTITCPSNISVPNDPNQCGAVVTFTAPTTSDNCPGTTAVSVPASGSFFPAGTTTVTSTATDAHGNIATCTFTVTVNVPAPAITTQPQSVAICSGDNTSFSVVATGGAFTYQWQVSTNGGTNYSDIPSATSASLPLTNVPSTSNGNMYRVVITNTCGGGNIASNAVTLSVNPKATIVIGSLPAGICLSDTLVNLTATPVGGIWSGTGITGNTFLPYQTAAGSYILTYRYLSNPGCSATGTVTAVVNNCPERAIDLRNGGVLLYPNPNDGHFNLKINSTLYNSLGVKIYTSTGALVGVKTFSGLQYARVISVDLGNLAAGIYRVEVYYQAASGTLIKNFNIVIAQH